MAEAIDSFNRQQVLWLMGLIKNYLPPDGKVGILGLTYKAHSDVVTEAQGLLLAQALANNGLAVTAYDPLAMENARRLLSEAVTLAATIEECIQKADIIVITTPWPEFKQIPDKEFIRDSQPRVLIDCRRILDKMKHVSGITYVPLGIGSVFFLKNLSKSV